MQKKVVRPYENYYLSDKRISEINRLFEKEDEMPTINRIRIVNIFMTDE